MAGRRIRCYHHLVGLQESSRFALLRSLSALASVRLRLRE